MAGAALCSETATFLQTLVFHLYESLYKDLPEDTIGEKIKKYRLLKGMSKVELARTVGLTSRSQLNYIGRYESGGKIPDNIQHMICNILDFNKF